MHAGEHRALDFVFTAENISFKFPRITKFAPKLVSLQTLSSLPTLPYDDISHDYERKSHHFQSLAHNPPHLHFRRNMSSTPDMNRSIRPLVLPWNLPELVRPPCGPAPKPDKREPVPKCLVSEFLPTVEPYNKAISQSCE